MEVIKMSKVSFDDFTVLDTFGSPEDYLKPRKEEGDSWNNRKDGRTSKETSEAVIGGNTREIQACPEFRNRVHKLFVQGKIVFDVTRCESLTDVTINKTNSYKDSGDSLIELLHGDLGSRSGKCELKIQPKLYTNGTKQLIRKVALKEVDITKYIKAHRPVIVVLRWNPLEYEEAIGKPKWLVLSVDNLKTLGEDTHGYAAPISLEEYPNRETGICRKGWRLYEKSPLEKYNDQWIDWATFAQAELVESMLWKIWNDLGHQSV